MQAIPAHRGIQARRDANTRRHAGLDARPHASFDARPHAGLDASFDASC